MQHGSAQILQQAIHVDRYALTKILRSAQGGNQRARTQAVLAVCSYAQKIARHYYTMWIPKLADTYHYDDCYAAALEGIARSIDDYDVDGINSFTGYCSDWIRTYVQRSIYRSMGILRIPEAHLASLAPTHPMLATRGMSYEATIPGDNEGRSIAEDVTDDRYQGTHSFDHVDADDAAQSILRDLAIIDERLPTIAQQLANGGNKKQCSIDLGITTRMVEQLLNQGRLQLQGSGLL